MARTKQTARRSTGGKAPRKQVVHESPKNEKNTRLTWPKFMSQFSKEHPGSTRAAISKGWSAYKKEHSK